MKIRMSRLGDSLSLAHRVGQAIRSRANLKRRAADSLTAVRRRLAKGWRRHDEDTALKIARYNLVLLDADGQVLWGKEFDPGGQFEFKPGQRLYISCEFTNHSRRQAEVAEYEIELAGEDGSVVSRFGNSFGDAIVVAPGESKNFTAQWSL